MTEAQRQKLGIVEELFANKSGALYDAAYNGELITHAAWLLSLVREQEKEIERLITKTEDAEYEYNLDISIQISNDNLEKVKKAEAELAKMIEQEALVCPEDVGCDEYIPILEKKLQATRERIKALEKIITPCPTHTGWKCLSCGLEWSYDEEQRHLPGCPIEEYKVRQLLEEGENAKDN